MSNQVDPGNWIVQFGKYKGKKLENIDLIKLDSYLAWLEKIEAKTEEACFYIGKIKSYLQQPHIQNLLEQELRLSGKEID